MGGATHTMACMPRTPWLARRVQRTTFLHQLSPSTFKWVPGTELALSGLHHPSPCSTEPSSVPLQSSIFFRHGEYILYPNVYPAFSTCKLYTIPV